MKAVSPEDYLNYAIDNIGNPVIHCANVDIYKKEGNYHVRTIFPYQISARRKRPCDLPYLEYCTFTYVVVEHGLSFKDKMEGETLYLKLKRRLKASKEVQLEIAQSVRKNALHSNETVCREIEGVFCYFMKRKHGGLHISGEYTIQAIEFNYQTGRSVGVVSDKAASDTPNRQVLRKISQELHRFHLKTFLDVGEMWNESYRHRGWMPGSIVPFYCGIDDLRRKEAEFLLDTEQRRCPVSVEELERIFSVVSYAVSIPLFSFSVFSILKYFYPKYPSRLSVNDSYKSVNGKIGKILYLSIEGEDEHFTEQVAGLYCGSFLRNSLGGTPARREESKYVHDGIVIYVIDWKKRINAMEHRPARAVRLKVTERSIGSYIVKDACALFVNAQFPMSAVPIRVKLDESQGGCSQMDAFKDKIDELLRHFILCWEEYFQRVTSDPNLFQEWSKTHKQNADKKILNERIMPNIKAMMAGSLARAETAFADIACEPAQKRKCAYLLSAFYFFTKYLECTCAPDEAARVEALKTTGTRAIQALCRECVPLENMEQIFSQYISHLFETNALILIRDEQRRSISGWFDPQRNSILLPYTGYYDEFLQFSEKGKIFESKREFQEQFLAPLGFIQMKPNGKASSYVRADTKVQVSPVSAGSVPKENVIRISLEPFERLAPLSKKALEQIHSLSSQKVRRRAPNRGGEND